MRARLFSKNTLVATKELNGLNGNEYSRVANASLLVFRGHYYRFCGIFDHCVNYEECEAPVNVDGVFK